jgi:hypothetical protein
MQSWRDPVGMNRIPRVNRCTLHTCIIGGVAKKWEGVAKTWEGVARIWAVAKISDLYCTIQQSSAQRSDVAGGSQRSAGGRRHC